MPRRARPRVETDTLSVEQGPSSPTLNIVAHRLDPVRQTPRVEVNFATPQCLQFERRETGEHRRCCRRNGAEAPHYPDGHSPVQSPDLQETAVAGHQVLCPDGSSIEEPRTTLACSRRTLTPGPPSRGSKRRNAFAVASTDGARQLEVSTEGRVIVECQAQVFHAGSDSDLSPLKPQAITRWRRPVIGPAAEPHCLRFVRGHT